MVLLISLYADFNASILPVLVVSGVSDDGFVGADVSGIVVVVPILLLYSATNSFTSFSFVIDAKSFSCAFATVSAMSSYAKPFEKSVMPFALTAFLPSLP